MLPLRTLTCTEEYPLVTFLTERMTDDMAGDERGADLTAQG